MADWSFLTNDARALLLIARDPDTRLRDLAAALDVTERTAFGIVADLADAGYVVKLKDGRRNRYRVQADLPLPDPIGRQRTIGELLDHPRRHPDRAAGPTRRHLNERSVMAPTPSLLDATAVRHTDRRCRRPHDGGPVPAAASPMRTQPG